MKRVFSLEPWLQKQISQALSHYELKLEDAKSLAKSVLRLSDFYLQNPTAETPWQEPWAQIAYLVYFLPLNYLRAKAVVFEGQRTEFFSGLQQVIDFGAGPGTASLALKDIFPRPSLIEKAEPAQQLAKKFFAFDKIAKTYFDDLDPGKKTLSLFSYSLTELKSLPPWALKSEALMVLEPSTQEDGRKLQSLRQDLLQKGFFAWAPCTHQENCPLLIHSKKDWCHDRIYFDAPAWFREIETHLPMKNQNLTFSYLLMRKTPPPLSAAKGRLVGDQLIEKGKTRQLFCRSDKREFLSWLHRQGEAPELYRGEIFTLPAECREVANEIRL